MKKLLATVLSSSWAWAVLPSILTIAVIHRPSYQLHLSIKSTAIGDRQQIKFYDLNGDQISEKIIAMPSKPLNNFPITDYMGHYFDQWNLPDELFPEPSAIGFGNADHDQFSEIYIFTRKADSVFLNINEFLEPTGVHAERIFISKVNLVQGELDSQVSLTGFHDVNADGVDELYFRITTGFGLWPRTVYSYDIQNKRVQPGPYTAINFNHPVLCDLDADGHPEIISSMTASGNHNFTTPFTDYSAWVMVLDENLNIKFPPYEFKGFGGALEVAPVSGGVGVAYNYFGVGTPDKTPGIYLFGANGDVRKILPASEVGLTGKIRIYSHKDKLTLLGNQFVLLDARSLSILKTSAVSAPSFDVVLSEDLNGDANPDFLLYDPEGKKLMVISDEGEELAAAAFDNGYPSDYSWERTTAGSRLFLRTDKQAGFISFEPVPWYSRLPFYYPMIYLGLVGFITLIRYLNTIQIEKKEGLKRKLLSLQLISIKSQLDPHFTFNALNSVAALVYQHNRHTAYDALNQFTKLLRQMLEDAETFHRSLNKELEFVRMYLALESLRFEGKFTYKITTSDNITGQEMIPKLCIQTYVENAIKHGVMPLKGKGMVTIHIEKETQLLKITIEDNGRGPHFNVESESGRGLKMITRFYELLNELEPGSVTHEIKNRSDDGTTTGTRVEVLAKYC